MYSVLPAGTMGAKRPRILTGQHPALTPALRLITFDVTESGRIHRHPPIFIHTQTTHPHILAHNPT